MVTKDLRIRDVHGNIVKDHQKNELSLGDKVACVDGVGQFARVYVGEIHRVTAKTIFIKCKDNWYGRTEIEASVAMNRGGRILKI